MRRISVVLTAVLMLASPTMAQETVETFHMQPPCSAHSAGSVMGSRRSISPRGISRSRAGRCS